MTRTNGVPETPPISFPWVEIGGSVYTLKYSLLAQFHLDKLGVNVPELMQTLIPRLPDGKADPNPPNKPGRVAAMMTLFAACTAHNFVELGQPIRRADEWALLIPDAQWSECCKAVGEALVKAQPAAAPSPAPAPAETPFPDLKLPN